MTPHESTSLPPLAGIDTAEGLKRVEEDQAFYLSILFKFHDRQRDFAARVRRLLMDSADRRAAEREAHTLKSLAATVGAKDLADAARALESGISIGADIPECQLLIEKLENRLAQVLAAIGGVEHLRASESVATSKLAGEELATLIDEARRLLAAFDVEVAGPVKRLCGALAGTARAERAKRLQELIGRYDYEAAKAELEALAREI